MKKHKLVILCGMSGSGKSTIETEIDKLGIAKKVISSTTRNPRSNEKNGEDYYFLSEEDFQEKLSQGLFAEHSEYTTVNGMAKYGMQMKDIKLNEGNHICVVNPDGMNQVINNLGKENCITIYIERDDRVRVCSTLMRDKSDDFGKVLEEATRRYKADKIDFIKMKDVCHYVVVNEVFENTVSRILDIIESEE